MTLGFEISFRRITRISVLIVSGLNSENSTREAMATLLGPETRWLCVPPVGAGWAAVDAVAGFAADFVDDLRVVVFVDLDVVFVDAFEEFLGAGF